jgi:hypothetical protein
MAERRAPLSRATLAVAVTVWFVAVMTGIVAMARYKGAPGEPANAPHQWPAASTLPRVAGKPTLILLAHPMCSCTRASLAELSRIVERTGDKLTTHVVFTYPAGATESWLHSDVWHQAKAIPGLDVRADPGGVETARFGAATSGQVLLYDAKGKLAFAGGITIARGHEGTSPGANRVIALVTQGHAELSQAPVFGCSLQDPPSEETQQ